MSTLKGIDVSKHQGVINWAKVKPLVDFAIIRCGYGSDMASQDDIKFKANIDACHCLGIPYGIYLYSYADTEEKLASEIKHTLRLIKDTTPFCVYFDMEDASTTKLGKAKLTQFGLTFCKAMVDAGYKAGIYANQYWFRTYLDPQAFASAGYSVWCAKYSTSEPAISVAYDIWQYSSSGRIDGISGNVDMNYMYKDIRMPVVQPTISKPKPEVKPEAKPTPADEVVYTVKSGDTLSGIAKKYNTTYQKLAAYNGIKNPNLISVGQKIKILNVASAAPTPAPAPVVKEVVYTVKKGDTLSAIAKKYGTTYQKIAADNGIKNPNLIRVGQKLTIKK